MERTFGKMEDMARARPLSANDYADWFINAVDRKSGEHITTLVVQRLLFLAQAWYLANTGRPLFADEFQAWSTGPICLAVFERFEYYTYDTIPEMPPTRVIRGEKLALIEQIREKYSRYSEDELEAIVQVERGPWKMARGGISASAACDVVIGKDEIRKFYGEKISCARS